MKTTTVSSCYWVFVVLIVVSFTMRKVTGSWCGTWGCPSIWEGHLATGLEVSGSNSLQDIWWSESETESGNESDSFWKWIIKWKLRDLLSFFMTPCRLSLLFWVYPASAIIFGVDSESGKKFASNVCLLFWKWKFCETFIGKCDCWAMVLRQWHRKFKCEPTILELFRVIHPLVL